MLSMRELPMRELPSPEHEVVLRRRGHSGEIEGRGAIFAPSLDAAAGRQLAVALAEVLRVALDAVQAAQAPARREEDVEGEREPVVGRDASGIYVRLQIGGKLGREVHDLLDVGGLRNGTLAGHTRESAPRRMKGVVR